MSESFREQIRNMKVKIQEKKTYEALQNNQLDFINSEIASLHTVITEMQKKIEENVDKINENKLKDFDTIFNTEMNKLRDDVFEIIENCDVSTTPRDKIDFKSELETQTRYILQVEQKVNDIEKKFAEILHRIGKIVGKPLLMEKPKLILHPKK